MATILVPTNQATLAAAYTAASDNDTIVLETVGPHTMADPPSLAKKLNIQSAVDAVINALNAATDYAFRCRVGCANSELRGLIIDGGDFARITAESGAVVSMVDCEIKRDTATSANYALYIQAGGRVDFADGIIDTRGWAARVQNGAICNISNAEISTSNEVAVRHLSLEPGAAGGDLAVDGCDIQSGTSSSSVEALVASAIGASTFSLKNSTISHASSSGHGVGVGSESAISGGDGNVAYEITRNTITGFRGASQDLSGIIHTIFVGFNANGPIDANTVIGGGYALVWKGTGFVNTTGYIARNIALNCNIGLRLKGITGALIVGNTLITRGVNSGACMTVSDDDGAGNANGIVNVGNVYVSVDSALVCSKNGVCSFALNKNNCYICNSLSSFKIDDVAKTWAEWVAGTGETGSFCVVKNGAAWDVYTSEAPTAVAWSLSACPIDTATGRIVNMVGNPLLKRGAVVTGVNDGGELDIWGNATPATGLNIGADQYDYAPGFGPWCPFDGTMPDLTLSADSPAALKSVQAWEGLPSEATMEKY